MKITDIDTRVYIEPLYNHFIVAFGHDGKREYREMSRPMDPNGINMWIGESNELEVDGYTELSFEEFMSTDNIDLRTAIKISQERIVSDCNEYPNG